MKTQGQQSDVLFLSGFRTGFGSFGGTLKDFTATYLGVFAAQHALAKAGVEGAAVDHVVFGNALQTSADAIYLARHVALRAGLPIETPAVTVNRLCGSGFESITQGAQQILLGESKIVLAGGAESMSQAPHVVRGARWGLRLGPAPPFEDLLWESLKDPQCGFSMAETAENLADKYQISRAEVDAYALTSQQRAKQAWDGGVFADEVAPVPIRNRKTKQDEPWAGRRAHAARHDRRGAGQADALLQEGRRGHGRERLRHLRRRRGGGAGQRGARPRGSSRSAGWCPGRSPAWSPSTWASAPRRRRARRWPRPGSHSTRWTWSR